MIYPDAQIEQAALRWKDKGSYLRGYIEKPAVILDVGANVGYSALSFVRQFPRATVYAIEPVLENYTMLVQNVKGHNVIPLHCALSNQTWYWAIGIEEGETSAGLSRLGLQGEWTVAIPMDELMISPAFIKIDVEGHGLEVLQGGKDTVRSAQLIQIERDEAAEEYLVELGFEYVTQTHPDAFYRNTR